MRALLYSCLSSIFGRETEKEDAVKSEHKWHKLFSRKPLGGRFYVEVLRARDLPSMDTQGEQDPYVKVVLLNAHPGASECSENVQDETEPIMEGGSNPVWTAE